MGKLVVTEFVSVDGVFEDPGGAEGYEHGGWTFEYARRRATPVQPEGADSPRRAGGRLFVLTSSARWGGAAP